MSRMLPQCSLLVAGATAGCLRWVSSRRRYEARDVPADLPLDPASAPSAEALLWVVRPPDHRRPGVRRALALARIAGATQVVVVVLERADEPVTRDVVEQEARSMLHRFDLAGDDARVLFTPEAPVEELVRSAKVQEALDAHIADGAEPLRDPLARALYVAVECTRDGAMDDAVFPLLLAWRLSGRSSRVADILDRVSDRAARRWIGGQAGAAAAEWSSVLREGDPADFRRLFNGLTRLSCSRATEGVEQLDARGDDPRLAINLARVMIYRAFPWFGQPAFWRAAQAVLIRVADARTLPLLTRARPGRGRALKTAIEKIRATLAQRLPAPEPSRDALESLAMLEAEVPPP